MTTITPIFAECDWEQESMVASQLSIDNINTVTATMLMVAKVSINWQQNVS